MSVVAAVVSMVDRAEDVLHSGSLTLGESALVGGEKSQFLLMCTSTRRLLEFLECVVQENKSEASVSFVLSLGSQAIVSSIPY